MGAMGLTGAGWSGVKIFQEVFEDLSSRDSMVVLSFVEKFSNLRRWYAAHR